MAKNRVRIEVFMNLSCKTEEQLRENLQRALQLEGIEAELTFSRLTEEEADKLGLRGSPTILINGEEFQPVSQKGFT
ncbi:MAG: thioredoxin family protein [Caldimicrobium sp.]